MSIYNKEKEIFYWMRKNTELTDECIAGIMGNLEAESNCEPIRLQCDFSADRAKSVDYVKKVDSGVISAQSFANDAKGFGLAQWTYNARKANLLKFCKSRGKSIGDLESQLEFMITEMQTEYQSMYKKLLGLLSKEDAIVTSASLVLEEYERPAFLNYYVREVNAINIFNKYHDTVSDDEIEKEVDESWLDDEIAFLTEERDHIQGRIDYYTERRNSL